MQLVQLLVGINVELPRLLPLAVCGRHTIDVVRLTNRINYRFGWGA